MVLTPGSVTVDAVNVHSLAHWWADQLDGAVVYTTGDAFAVVTTAHSAMSYCFQKATGPAKEKNRLHLDFVVKDLDDAVQRLVAAGAVEHGSHVMEGGISYAVLGDPEGNRFCVSTKPAGAWFFGAKTE